MGLAEVDVALVERGSVVAADGRGGRGRPRREFGNLVAIKRLSDTCFWRSQCGVLWLRKRAVMPKS